jgi:hypothetical protein
MSVELADENVIITAERFNPSIVNQIWLTKKGLVHDGAFDRGCIFADQIAQIAARDFRLLIVPQRAQFVATVEAPRKQEVICDKLGLLVASLPETPYRAMGFNLT